MAVHPKIPGIEVTIRCDGQEVEEYPIENDEIDEEDREVKRHHELKTVTNYVESLSGKRFTIKLVVKRPYQLENAGLSFETSVDGEDVDNEVLDRKDWNLRRWDFLVKGPAVEKDNEGSYVQSMKFADIEPVGEILKASVVESHKKELAKMGEIGITVFRLNSIRLRKAPVELHKVNNASKEIHTKVLIQDPKSHAVNFEGTRQIEPFVFLDTEKVDGDDYPLVIFKFKYRSREVLKELGIIQMASVSPEPVDLNVEAQRPVTAETFQERIDHLPQSARLIPEASVDSPVSKASEIRAALEVSEAPQAPKASQAPQASLTVPEVSTSPERPAAPNQINPLMIAGFTPEELKSHFATYINDLVQKTVKSPNTQPNPSIKEESQALLAPSEFSEVPVKREQDGLQSSTSRKRAKKWTGKTIIDLTEDDEEDWANAIQLSD